MTQELMILAWSAIFCAFMWVPYILEQVRVQGFVDALSYPKHPAPMPDWAVRAKKAHANMVENLAPFAAVVLVADAVGVNNGTTELGATLFLLGRLVHYPVYIAAIPYARTLSFAVAWLGIVLIFLQLYGA